MGIAPVNKPNLFRNILQGAMAGMGAGLAAERPEQAFGAGMEAVESNQDREMKRQALTAQQGREQERLGLEKQRVGFEGQRVGIEQQQVNQQGEQVGAQVELSKAQRGLALIQGKQIEAAIDMLPQEMALKEYEAWGRMHANTGLQTVVELDATQTAQNAFLAANKAKIASGQYTFGPSTKPGKISVMQADPSKVISEEQSKNLSRDLNMKIPANIPSLLAIHIIDSTMQMRSVIYAAQEGYRKALDSARANAGIKVPPALEKQMAALDDQESQYASLLTLFDEKAVTDAKGNINHPWVGGIGQGMGGTMGRMKEKYPAVFGSLDPARATFRTLSNRVRAIKVHENYGGAVTPNELKLASTWVPDIDGMSPISYRQALVSQIELTKRARQNLIANSPALQTRQTEEYVRDPKTGKLVRSR